MVRRAIKYIKRSLNNRIFIDLYFKQANVFNTVLRMLDTKALDSASNHEKHRHSAIATNPLLLHLVFEPFICFLPLRIFASEHPPVAYLRPIGATRRITQGRFRNY